MAEIEFSGIEKHKYLRSLTLEELRDSVVPRLMLSRGYRPLPEPSLDAGIALYVAKQTDGTTEVTAVCTAAGPITLAASASDRLSLAIETLERAGDSSFFLGKVRARVDVLVLVVPETINDAAQKFIQSKLHGRHIQFFDKEKLSSLIDAAAPDVWREISANVTPYLRALSKLVDDQGVLSADTIHLLGASGGVIGAADSSYVEIKLVRPRTRISMLHGRRTENFEFEEITGAQLVKLKATKILVLGDAGSGKSTLLIRLAYLLAKEGVASPHAYRIPLHIRATELAENVNDDLFHTCSEAVQRMTKVHMQPFSEDDLNAGRVVLLIDGLDEVASDVARTMVMAKISTVLHQYPNVSTIITTRPYASIDRIAGIEKFTRYRISQISLVDAEKIISRVRGQHRTSLSTRETLRKLDSVHGIELNPLFVTVFGLLADTEKKDLPANITQLFSKFTELMLGRWDSNKGMAQQYQAKLKEDLVAKFAFTLHKARRMRFTRSEFESFVSVRLAALNLSSDMRVVVEETIDRSGLFRGEQNQLEFRHHLIQEYFAGLGIPGLSFARAIIGDDWWRTPIVFYFGKTPDAIDSLLDLASSISDKQGESCITVGLALQTLYLSPLVERLDVWKWVVECAANCLRDMQAQPETDYPLIDLVTYYMSARDSMALTGIEREDLGAIDWATRESADSEISSDLKAFWALTGLIELGEMELVEKTLSRNPIKDENLNVALYIGCQMVATVRAVDPPVREAAKTICKQLEDKTLSARVKLASEFKGRLLELRRGEIVALDDQYETPR